MAAPVFRMYREGDEVEINRVFEQVSGLVRSLDEWAWLYPPEVDGRVIVVAETGGEVVAHCAGTPLRVAVDGREPAAVGRSEATSRRLGAVKRRSASSLISSISTTSVPPGLSAAAQFSRS